MREFFNVTPTSLDSPDRGGRRLMEQEHLLMTPASYSHQIAMPHPKGPYGRRREHWFFMGGPPVSRERRMHGRRRWSSRTLCWYIVAVVLLQNALMAYNVARRSSTLDETVANWTTTITKSRAMTSAAAVVSPAVSGNRTSSALHSGQPAAVVKSPSPRTTGFVGGEDLMRAETDEKNERVYYRKRLTKVNPYRQEALLVPARLCDSGTVMVILVHSATPNVAQRAAIRETWGDAATTGRYSDGNLVKFCWHKNFVESR